MPTTTPHRPLSEGQIQTLIAGLNPKRVSKIKGMSYLEAWDVKATLIRVFGFAGFSADLIESEILRAEQVPQASNPNKMNWAITAKAVVRVTIHQTGATYTEAAIAGSKQPDFTESADMAIKSAESDALKRACIYMGSQFGLSLYDDGKTADVVKVVMAPGQEWPRPAQPAPQPQQPEPAPEQADPTPEQEVANLQNIVDGGDNGLPWTGGVSEEQRQANQALVDRATNMRRERELQERELQNAEADALNPNQ